MCFELSTILHYKNQVVVDYFCFHNPGYSVEEGQLLFTDLLAWIWLNDQRAKLGKKTYLFGPLLILDKMWHSFILHTRAYVDFSTKYWGCYFHHDIEPLGMEHILEEEELTDYLEDCFTYLGAEWVARYFDAALSDGNDSDLE
jgi:hypothetical protein